MLLVGAAGLFGSAGTLDWWRGWVYLAVGVAITALLGALAQASPELIDERRTAAAKAKPWDRWLVPLIGAFLPLASIVVAGFDRRFGWTRNLATWLSISALLMMVAAMLWTYWAMRANPFFSSHVRIQSDRGHRVVSVGPYAYVRHPGYTGSIVFSLAVPVLLGSLPALAVAAAFVPVIVARTFLEDRTLVAELDGYAEYTRRVRHRLVPFIW
jgi:protein-S-isoprenylcysteine O-methyltransferase Ste14